ncbi:hypothetical protein [Parapedobacter soli]|uniref:hypothetical protein n=1 Tax=Parapedobacter soli TaxID=416955 RepID=UPI0021C6B96F|nr:hypothetical protein [Parapedobacter soli]
MKTIDILEKYRKQDPNYADTLLTALMIVGEEEFLRVLGEAEKAEKRLELTYPIPFDVGPSDPSGVKIV